MGVVPLQALPLQEQISIHIPAFGSVNGASLYGTASSGGQDMSCWCQSSYQTQCMKKGSLCWQSRIKFCLLKKNTKMRKLKYIWHLSLGLEDLKHLSASETSRDQFRNSPRWYFSVDLHPLLTVIWDRGMVSFLLSTNQVLKCLSLRTVKK